MIREDRQAFGLLAGKVQTPGEALKYPLTAIPLALVQPNQRKQSSTLHQQSMTILRRLL